GADTVFGDDQAPVGAGIESGVDNFEISFDDADSLNDTLVGGLERDHIVINGNVDAAIDQDVADDIFVQAGSTAGVFSAGRRDACSTAAYQFVNFTIPADIDDVIVRAGGGNDRVEIAESLTT